MKEKFYYKVAEQVMTTFKGSVEVEEYDSMMQKRPYTVKGFSLMGKGLRYSRVNNDYQLMNMIIPTMSKKYLINHTEGKKIYHIFEDDLKEMVRRCIKSYIDEHIDEK